MSRTAIISVDGHVKASRAGYREYVEKKYRDDYDVSVKAAEDGGAARRRQPESRVAGYEAQWDSRSPVGNAREPGCGRGGAVPQRTAVPSESAGRLRAGRQSGVGSRRTTDVQPVARRLLRRDAGAASRTSCRVLRRHRAGDRGHPLGQRSRPRRDHDAGAQSRRNQLLRSGARSDLGCHPGRGPAGQPARRRRSSRLQLAGVRGDHDARGRERLLLQSVPCGSSSWAASSIGSRIFG